MKALIEEIQRRRVFNTFLPYLGFVWLLLQIVSVIAPMLNFSPLVNTFIAVILFAGIPVMLYLSWYFNFTTSGLEAIPDANSGEVTRFGLGRWFVFLAIMTGSGYLGFSYFYTVKVEYAKTEEGTSQQLLASSIAVIPFIDNSPEQDQDYLAKGIAEEIVSLLGNSKKLRVIATSSVNTLVNQGLDPISIARKLKVETVLSGTVRKAGNNIRLRVELIKVDDGKVVWSQSYTRNFEDIFALESAIARSTLNTLVAEFISADEFKHPSISKNSEAYLMYLKGREAYRKQTIAGLKEARKFFEQSIAIEPEYSQAYVSLADTIMLSADRTQNFDILPPDIAKTLAQTYLAKALIRTQALPDAFAVQGKVFELDGQLDNALASFNKAITINPSLAVAHMSKYALLRNLGREQEAFEALKTALEYNPESFTARYDYGIELNRRRQLPEAEAMFETLIADYPELSLGYAGLGKNYISTGALAKSYQNWSKAYAISPDNDDYLYPIVSILINFGLLDEALKFIHESSLQAYILLNNNEHSKLIELMAARREAIPQDPWVQFESSWFEMQSGNDTGAASALLVVDENLPRADKYAMPFCSPAIEISWAYLILGNNEKGQAIVDACAKELNQQKSSVLRLRAADYLDLRIAALNNDQNAVVMKLEKLIQQGFRGAWIFNDPLLDNVKELPEVQSLFKTLAGLIDEQRAELQNYLTSQPIDSEIPSFKLCEAEQIQCSLTFDKKIRRQLMSN